MPIKNHGKMGCIVQPSWNENRDEVTKLFVTTASMDSQNRETDPRLITILRLVDPMQNEYSQALNVSNSYLSTPAHENDVKECQQIFSDERLRNPSEISSFQLKFLEPAPLDRSLTRAELDLLWTSLQKLHTNGIVHNDVQIHNIMRNPSTGNLLWSDFGEARLREDLDEENWIRLVAKDDSNFESNVKNFQIMNKPRESKKRSRMNFDEDEATSVGASAFGFSLTEAMGIPTLEAPTNRLSRFLLETIGGSNSSPQK